MKEVREWAASILLALAIVLPISFLCKPTIVNGLSMQPTLDDKNIVVTESRIGSLKYGDIIVFDARPIEQKLLIKRVIGLSGDTIEIKNGFVYVNGSKIDEPYLRSNTMTRPNMKVEVPQNEVFVLGDNRTASEDSRFIGTVSVKKIKGRAYFRIYPFNQIGKF